ncbi:hypothetical protein [Taklimakanibacter lacteus]|uniref:hypothetical protein n=1 Tax=Taklimakanibacter lacteus TaxID=2268456 RepID=UPI0013C4520A
MKTAICAMAGVLAFASAAAAQPTADDHRLDDAWKAAIEEQEGVLTPQQFATVNGLAYQAAVSRLCAGFEIDNVKYAKAVNAIVNSGGDKLSDELKLERQTGILIAIGTSYGLFLAEGAARKDAFCASATETRNDKETPHLWE